MNKLRILKSEKGYYKNWNEGNQEPDSFYQFALHQNNVKSNFSEMGFNIVHEAGWDGMKGLKDEIPIVRGLFQKLYDSPAIPARITKGIINKLASHWCGHIYLLVLRKQ